MDDTIETTDPGMEWQLLVRAKGIDFIDKVKDALSAIGYHDVRIAAPTNRKDDLEFYVRAKDHARVTKASREKLG